MLYGHTNFLYCVWMIMDRLSGMPDSLLCFILSRLPLREAVRCSLLSRRWRYLWAYFHILQLSPCSLLSNSFLEKPDATRVAEYVINDLLFFHTAPLQTLSISYDQSPTISKISCFSTDNVWRWVQWAAFKNVEEITLKDKAECRCGLHPRQPPPSLFLCHGLRKLHLEFYSLLQLRTSFGSCFPLLTACNLISVELSDHGLQTFMALCPHLQVLNVESSHGLQSPTIAAPNLQHLCLRLLERGHILTVECPHLMNIVVDNFNGAIMINRFIALYGGFLNITVIDGKEPVSLELDTSRCPYHSISILWFIEQISTFRSLKRLSLRGGRDLLKAEGNLVRFLTTLSELEELSVHGSFVKHLAASYIPSSVDSPLKKLRNMNADLDEPCGIELFNWILTNSPDLQKLNLTVAMPCEAEHKLRFFKELLGLQRASTEARIIITQS